MALPGSRAAHHLLSEGLRVYSCSYLLKKTQTKPSQNKNLFSFPGACNSATGLSSLILLC